MATKYSIRSYEKPELGRGSYVRTERAQNGGMHVSVNGSDVIRDNQGEAVNLHSSWVLQVH